jgi:hypothetical protein
VTGAPTDRAFPRVQSSSVLDTVTSVWSEGGLTKRELLAAFALQGCIATRRQQDSAASVAASAVLLADELLLALGKAAPE